jgi:hypothetical protein
MHSFPSCRGMAMAIGETHGGAAQQEEEGGGEARDGRSEAPPAVHAAPASRGRREAEERLSGPCPNTEDPRGQERMQARRVLRGWPASGSAPTTRRRRIQWDGS